MKLVEAFVAVVEGIGRVALLPGRAFVWLTGRNGARVGSTMMIVSLAAAPFVVLTPSGDGDEDTTMSVFELTLAGWSLLVFGVALVVAVRMIRRARWLRDFYDHGDFSTIPEQWRKLAEHAAVCSWILVIATVTSTVEVVGGSVTVRDAFHLGGYFLWTSGVWTSIDGAGGGRSAARRLFEWVKERRPRLALPGPEPAW